mgnify:CR=1 FL=1
MRKRCDIPHSVSHFQKSLIIASWLLAFLFTGTAFAQENRTIKGIVRDVTGGTAYRCQRHTERYQQRRHYRCGRQLHTDRSCRCNTLYRLHGLCHPGDKPGKTKKARRPEDYTQRRYPATERSRSNGNGYQKRYETCRLCHQYHQCRRIGKGRSTQFCLCHVR